MNHIQQYSIQYKFVDYIPFPKSIESILLCFYGRTVMSDGNFRWRIFTEIDIERAFELPLTNAKSRRTRRTLKKKKNSLNSYLPQPPKSTPNRVPDFSAAHQFASAAGPSSLSPVGGLKIDPLRVPTDGDAKTIASFFAFVSGQEGQFTPVQLRLANSYLPSTPLLHRVR